MVEGWIREVALPSLLVSKVVSRCPFLPPSLGSTMLATSKDATKDSPARTEKDEDVAPKEEKPDRVLRWKERPNPGQMILSKAPNTTKAAIPASARPENAPTNNSRCRTAHLTLATIQ